MTSLPAGGRGFFVPSVLTAAGIQPGDRVLDVATGTGEAAVAIIPVIGASGHLIGADIAPLCLKVQAAD